MRILIVRLSALGDIVHALPVLSALGDAVPGVEVDWIVDARYAGIFDHVDGLRRRLVVRADGLGGGDRVVSFAGPTAFWAALRHLRQQHYDVALDLQGLIKSAALAGLSGARRVVGFPAAHLREPQAGWFYGETTTVAEGAHIIEKNLSMLPAIGLPAIGLRSDGMRFPIRVPASPVADDVAATVAGAGTSRFALVNPGGGWPNKRWRAARFGELAARLSSDLALPSFVLWGAGEETLAQQVAAHAAGGATVLPQTTLGDVLALASRASLMISGDTGPMHLAAAVGTPIVGLHGPTWPARNGPWDPADVTVSRADTCQCHHKRRCQRVVPCLDEVSVDEVFRAVQARLAKEPRA